MGSTGFILSIVSNLVPQRYRRAAPQKLPVPVVRRSPSPSNPSSSAGSVTKDDEPTRPLLLTRDSEPLPDLTHSSLDSNGSSSDDDASIQTSDNVLPIFDSQRQLASSASVAQKQAANTQQHRRTSLDLVRQTFHIAPKSPPSSRSSSTAGNEHHDRPHCPHPKMGHLFSSSSREPSPPHSDAEGNDALLEHADKRPHPERHPERRMSLRLSTGFRSRKRRAMSEAERTHQSMVDASAGEPRAALARTSSPPLSPTSSTPRPRSNLRQFFASPEGKPKPRRSASEQVASGQRMPLDRHQLMAAAQKDREREASQVLVRGNLS